MNRTLISNLFLAFFVAGASMVSGQQVSESFPTSVVTANIQLAADYPTPVSAMLGLDKTLRLQMAENARELTRFVDQRAGKYLDAKAYIEYAIRSGVPDVMALRTNAEIIRTTRAEIYAKYVEVYKRNRALVPSNKAQNLTLLDEARALRRIASEAEEYLLVPYSITGSGLEETSSPSDVQITDLLVAQYYARQIAATKASLQ